jgi:hypothetical protein
MKILDIWDFGHLVFERYPHKSQVIHFFFVVLRIDGGFSVEMGSLWGFSDRIFGDVVGPMLVGL